MAVINGTEGDDWGLKKLLGTAFDDTINALGGNDEVDGGGGNDMIFGGIGNDSLFGGIGNDLLAGGAGADKLIGGTGIDTVSYADSTVAVTVNNGVGIGSGGTAAGDTYTGIERFVGSEFNDTLGGSSIVNDILLGRGGNDVVNGFLGNDVLLGDAGDDTITGGGGNDAIDGGIGIDTVVYSDSASAVSINLKLNINTGGTAQGDTLANVENVIGSSYADSLIGNAGANRLDGGAGNDQVHGDAGADDLVGGSGIDSVNYGDSNAGVRVDLAIGNGFNGHAEGDDLSGFENLTGSSFADSLAGTDFANRILAGSGNDSLLGRYGNDTLSGGAGKDSINGGDGADTYSYGNVSDSTVAAAGRDLISFWKEDGDKIDLAPIDANAATASSDAFTFIGSNAFSAAGQVRFYQSGGKTFVEANTTGTSGAEMAIEFTGAQNLTASDFIL